MSEIFGLDTTVLVVIVLAVGVFLFLYLYQSKGGLESVYNELCTKYPSLCNNKTQFITGVAADSTEALACGINTVASGSDSENSKCLAKYSPTSAVVKAGFMLSEDENKLATVECPSIDKEPEIEYDVDRAIDFRTVRFRFDGKEWSYAVKESTPGGGDYFSDFYSVYEPTIRKGATHDIYPQIVQGLRGKGEVDGLTFLVETANSQSDDFLIIHHPNGREERVEEDRTKQIDAVSFVEKARKDRQTVDSCTIKSFRLPQDFGDSTLSDMEERLGGFGDPQYLAYWQAFPPGEDMAWRGPDKWYENLGTLMFAGFCAAHIAGPLISTASRYAVKSAVSPIGAVEMAKADGEKAIQSLAEFKASLNGKMQSFKEAAQGLTVTDVKAALAIPQNALRKGISRLAAIFSTNRYITSLSKWKTAEEFIQDIEMNGGKKFTADEVYLVRRIYKDISLNKFGEDSLMGFLPISEQASVMEGVIKGAGGVAAEEIAKKAAAVAKKLILTPEGRTFTAYTGIDSIAAYFLGRQQSEGGKYTDEYPNSIVLQKSMFLNDLRDGYSLKGTETDGEFMKLGRPVLVKREEGKGVIYGDVAPFNLASPCKADLEIKKASGVACTEYTYDSINKLTYCGSPREPGWTTPKVNCGSLEPIGGIENKPKMKEKVDEIIKKEKDIIHNPQGTEIFRKLGDGKTLVAEPITNTILMFDAAKGKFTKYLQGSRLKIGDVKEMDMKDLAEKEYGIEHDGAIDEFRKHPADCKLADQRVKDFELVGPLVGLPAGNLYPILGIHDNETFSCAPESINTSLEVSGIVGSSLYTRITQPGLLELEDLDGVHFSVSTEVIGKRNSDGQLEDFNTVILKINKFTSLSGGTIVITGDSEFHDSLYITLSDYNGDGLVDSVGHYVVYGIDLQNSAIYSDLTSDSNVDVLQASNCKIDGITVEPKKSGYRDSPNFCYQNDYSGAVGWASTTASFAVSAIAKATRVGGAGASVMAAAVDCTLAFINYRYVTRPWPG